MLAAWPFTGDAGNCDKGLVVHICASTYPNERKKKTTIKLITAIFFICVLSFIFINYIIIYGCNYPSIISGCKNTNFFIFKQQEYKRLTEV